MCQIHLHQHAELEHGAFLVDLGEMEAKPSKCHSLEGSPGDSMGGVTIPWQETINPVRPRGPRNVYLQFHTSDYASLPFYVCCLINYGSFFVVVIKVDHFSVLF